MRILLLTESLVPPVDEGYKKFAYCLLREVGGLCDALRIAPGGTDASDASVRVDKLMLAAGVRGAFKGFAPDAVVYIPVSSATPASIVRARILRCHAGGAPVALVGLQPRQYHPAIRDLLRRLSPDILYVQSKLSADKLTRDGFRAEPIYAGVDCERFSPASADERTELRAKYGLAQHSRIVLHVGHINENRNVQSLISIARLPNVQVVIVGSSSTVADGLLMASLRSSGVVVMDGYVERIQDLYRLADVYVFPVSAGTAAIEMPLSVMEAMSCNLPIITTKFGGLVDCFSGTEGVFFVDQASEIAGELPLALQCTQPGTRRKVEPFGWSAIARRIVDDLDRLVQERQRRGPR